MKKIYKTLLFLILITFPLQVSSHVQHYENLKKIEFDIYRNGKNIGKHIFVFKKNSENLL